MGLSKGKTDGIFSSTQNQNRKATKNKSLPVERISCGKTKKRKHKREAKRLLNIISGWAKKDNPNVLHQHNLLLAEFRSMEGKLDEAELLYTRAFRLASRSGFRHEAAMINELTAEFFRDQKKSLDDAKYKMEEACKLYEEWGCQIKADMLRKEYEVLIEQPIDVVVKVA